MRIFQKNFGFHPLKVRPILFKIDLFPFTPIWQGMIDHVVKTTRNDPESARFCSYVGLFCQLVSDLKLALNNPKRPHFS